MKSSASSKVMIRRNSSTQSNAHRTPPSNIKKCDLCEMGTKKWKNRIMQECKTCGVCVHETCYGLAPTERKDPLFQCMACKAVGKTVEVRSKKDPRATFTLTQHKRPKECALCSVSDGIHAMHPLFDSHGREGRQHTLPADEKRGLPRRLAWIHSLCGFTLTQHGSLVYACDEKGRYADEDGEWRYSENESSASDDDSEEGGPIAVHHFVECSKIDGEHTPLSAMIEMKQKSLVCSVCGRRDWKKGCMRIPMQCTAGNDGEHYSNCHPELSEPCTVALHVGCARWRQSNIKHVYFYPGEHPDGDDNMPYKDTVSECYCEAHAKEVSDFIRPQKKARRIPEEAASTRLIPRVAPKKAARRNLAHERRLMRKESGGTRMVQSKKARQASLAAQTHISAATPSAILSPSLKGSTLNRGTRRNSIRKALQSEEVFAKPLKPSKATALRKRSHVPLKTNPLQDIETLAFPSKRTSLTIKKQPKENAAKKNSAGFVSKKRKVTRDKLFERCSNDLIEKVREAMHLGQDTTAVSNACRDSWMEKTSLQESEFVLLWKEIDSFARKTLSAAKAAPKNKARLPRTEEARIAPPALVPKRVSSRNSRKRNWDHLLVTDPNYAGDFEIGEWDSIRVVGMN